MFYAYWPKQTGNPFAAILNNIRKYVVSTTLDEPLPWSNSTLVKRDVRETLQTVKERQDEDIVVFGSALLVQSLLRWKLVDELTLLIHPLILGSGRRLFSSNGVFAPLQLSNAKPTGTGVVIVTHQPANKSKPPDPTGRSGRRSARQSPARPDHLFDP